MKLFPLLKQKYLVDNQELLTQQSVTTFTRIKFSYFHKIKTYQEHVMERFEQYCLDSTKLFSSCELFLGFCAPQVHTNELCGKIYLCKYPREFLHAEK